MPNAPLIRAKELSHACRSVSPPNIRTPRDRRIMSFANTVTLAVLATKQSKQMVPKIYLLMQEEDVSILKHKNL